MLLDIIKSQSLRKSIVAARNELLARKTVGEKIKIEHKKQIYFLTPVCDYYGQGEVTGFNLVVESKGASGIQNLVHESWEMNLARMRLKFRQEDGLKMRISKSLKFLHQIFGVSGKCIIDLIDEIRNELKVEESPKLLSPKVREDCGG